MEKNVIRHDAMEKMLLDMMSWRKVLLGMMQWKKSVIRYDAMEKIVFLVLFCSFSVSLPKLFSYAVENIDR